MNKIPYIIWVSRDPVVSAAQGTILSAMVDLSAAPRRPAAPSSPFRSPLKEGFLGLSLDVTSEGIKYTSTIRITPLNYTIYYTIMSVWLFDFSSHTHWIFHFSKRIVYKLCAVILHHLEHVCESKNTNKMVCLLISTTPQPLGRGLLHYLCWRTVDISCSDSSQYWSTPIRCWPQRCVSVWGLVCV